MTATKRTADTLIIFAVILLAWQALHQAVGSTALPAPMSTLAYLAKFVPSARFAENAWATLVTFFWALLLSYAMGLTIGTCMGVHRLSGADAAPVEVADRHHGAVSGNAARDRHGNADRFHADLVGRAAGRNVRLQGR